MIAKSQRRQKNVWALVWAAALGLCSVQASAFSLGRLSVQSALGEPLRAEIDILEISDEEVNSLRPRLAQPDAFRTNGMDYSPALVGLQITLHKRANGRSYLRLSNNRPVNDPYVDLILEATWSSGRIVRDYTMLFDPPSLNAGQAPTPQAPQVSALPQRNAPTAPPALPAADIPAAELAPARSTPSAPAVATRRRSTTRAADLRPRAESPKPTSSAALGQRITVKAGDTAGKIALAQKPAEVSLDQMLVAMLRANPHAFIDGNVNRIRRGALLNMPGTQDVQGISDAEARQIILTQSKDFNVFRQRLAGRAPAHLDEVANRKAGGTVQTQLEDKPAATVAPDKLTLSKGSVQAGGAEDKLAKELRSKEADSRAAELAKNIAELDKLSQAAAPAPAPGPVASSPAVSAPANAQAPSPDAIAPTAAASTPAPAASAPLPRPAGSTPAPATPLPVAHEPSLIDELLDNPLVPIAASGLVALLAGLALYRSRRRRQAALADSAFLDTRLQTDSLFAASGGQRIDTHASGSSGTHALTVYSSSQLNTGDDVDPVAEADVYLAYGRDQQAEEILKEALSRQPNRVAVHEKLCEIYASRRDAKSLEGIAKVAKELTASTGPQWKHICDMGNKLDPDNLLYEYGASFAPTMPTETRREDTEAEGAPTGNAAGTAPAASTGATPKPSLAPQDAPNQSLPHDAEPDSKDTSTAPVSDNSLEFDLSSLPELIAPEPAPETGSAAQASETKSVKPALPTDDNLLNFDLGGLSLEPDTPTPSPKAETESNAQDSAQPAASMSPATAAAQAEHDLTAESEAAPAQADFDTEDPLATKLALANEFKAIGDTDGARSLIEEIIAEASGEMKTRAEKALADLD